MLYYLLAYIIFNEKSTVSLSFFLCVMCLFVLLLIWLSLCYCFEQFDYDVPYCVFILVSCAWSLLSFLGLWVYSFHQIWTNFPHYFFKYFAYFPSFFLSLVTIIHLLGHLKLSHRRLMHFLKTPFSVFHFPIIMYSNSLILWICLCCCYFYAVHFFIPDFVVFISRSFICAVYSFHVST